MEQPRYWMWSRRRPQGLATYDDSWEEQAFAEDTTGTLGGCVWPPRSYSCSFCRREFRSAQALGGHMNVHRRDRARLKQSSPNSSNIIDNFQSQGQSQPSFDSYQDQSHHHKNRHQVCSFLNFNPNPNAADHQDQACPEKNLLRALSSQTASKEEENLSSKSPCSSTPKSSSSSDLIRKDTDPSHSKRRRTDQEGGFRVRADNDLSVSLNLFRRARPASHSSGRDDQADRVGCKRKRIENWALPNLLLVDRSPSSIDHGLDLELRLGGTA